MGDDHGSPDALVARKYPDGAYVLVVLQQVRGEAVAWGVGTNRLDDTFGPSGVVPPSL